MSKYNIKYKNTSGDVTITYLDKSGNVLVSPTGVSGSLLALFNNDTSGSSDLVWVSSSKQLLVSASSVVVTGSLIIKSDTDNNPNTTPLIAMGTLTNDVMLIRDTNIMYTGSSTMYNWNANPVAIDLTTYTGPRDSMLITKYGSGSASHKSFPYVEYGIFGVIDAGNYSVLMSSSYGTYSPEYSDLTGSLMVEVNVVGVKSGSGTDAYVHRYMNGIKKTTPISGVIVGSDTLIFRYRSDAVWNSILQWADSQVQVQVIDNGEGSIWSGTVSIWAITDTMGRKT